MDDPEIGAAAPDYFERDFEPPGAEEVEELMEPTLAETLEAVTDAVSTVAASLVTTDSDATATTKGFGNITWPWKGTPTARFWLVHFCLCCFVLFPGSTYTRRQLFCSIVLFCGTLCARCFFVSLLVQSRSGGSSCL